MRSRRLMGGVAALALMGGSVLMAGAPAQAGSATAPSFSSETKPKVQKSSDGEVSSVQMDGSPAPRPSGVSSDASASEVAKAHMEKEAKRFGVSADDLKVNRSAKLAGGHVVKFDQTVDGVDVLGGQLVTSLDHNDALEFVVGESSKQTDATFPDISDDLSSEVIDAVKEKVLNDADLKSTDKMTVKQVGKKWYSPKLLGEDESDSSLYPVRELMVRTSERPDVAYKVLVNAENNEIELAYNTIKSGLDRLVCDYENQAIGDPERPDPNEYDCGAVVDPTRSEGDSASGQQSVDDVYDWSKEISERYASYVNLDITKLIGTGEGRTTDNKKLRSTVRVCTQDECPWANAFWDGAQMVLGDGVLADDVLAHEMTHGVNDHTAGLEYVNQSGALDEGLADAWGEIIDQHNGDDDDTPENAWILGEGSPVGVGRDMSDPPSGNPQQPDKVSSEHYYTGPEDNGGVHINSGVFNKAVYLLGQHDNAMTEFNGQTVRSIGPAKMGKVLFSTQNMLTAGSDFNDVAEVMPMACEKYVDAPESYVTADDCAQVEAAVKATEMDQPAPTARR